MCEIMSDVIVCSLNANAFGIFNKQLCGLRSRANGTDRECARVQMSNSTKFTKYLCTIMFSRHFNYHWPIVCCYTYVVNAILFRHWHFRTAFHFTSAYIPRMKQTHSCRYLTIDAPLELIFSIFTWPIVRNMQIYSTWG